MGIKDTLGKCGDLLDLQQLGQRPTSVASQESQQRVILWFDDIMFAPHNGEEPLIERAIREAAHGQLSIRKARLLRRLWTETSHQIVLFDNDAASIAPTGQTWFTYLGELFLQCKYVWIVDILDYRDPTDSYLSFVSRIRELIAIGILPEGLNVPKRETRVYLYSTFPHRKIWNELILLNGLPQYFLRYDPASGRMVEARTYNEDECDRLFETVMNELK